MLDIDIEQLRLVVVSLVVYVDSCGVCEFDRVGVFVELEIFCRFVYSG